MSSTMKMSLLALISTAVAVPHYGGHSSFHHKPSGAVPAYPEVPQGTGSPAYPAYPAVPEAESSAPYPAVPQGTGSPAYPAYPAVPEAESSSAPHPAVPQGTGYPAYPAVPEGSSAPYPTGGWSGYNSTVVPQPTAGHNAYPTGPAGGEGYPTGPAGHEGGYPTKAGHQGGKITSYIDVTSTSTTTLYSTVTVRPTPSAGGDKDVTNNEVPAGGNGQCGPATVTVTAHEEVTVTVTPGYEATPAPQVSATPAEKPSQKPVEYPAAPPAAPTSQKEYPTEKPAQSSAAPSAAPSAPAGGNTYTGGKRGLAYNDANLCKSIGGKFGWGYNWGQVENNDIGTQFIPTMHGPTKSSAEEWLANVEKAVTKGSKAVMGFNECDHTSQCNMSPEAACAAWKTYMNPVKAAHPELTIIGPSVTNGETSKGMGVDGWLAPFTKACPDAAIDATNIHFYDIYDETTVDRFKANIEKAFALTGKPVWITEFGLNPGSASKEQAEKFLKEAMSYCDSSDKVQGYSWFMVGNGEHQLAEGSGPSDMGRIYAGAN